MLCEYGCGKKAYYKQSNGKFCCSKFYSQCDAVKNKTKYGSFYHGKNEQRTKLLLFRKIIRILKYKNKPKYCEYGCGNKSKYFLKTSYKWCCSKYITQCKSHRNKNRLSSIGNNHSVGLWECKYGKDKSDKLKVILRERMNGNDYGCGIKHTIFFKNKQSLRLLGDKNHAWRGGISYDPYCEQWSDQDYKESIKKRDGYKCLNPECNKMIDKLCIHHIDYNKKNCHPSNLITVCFSCNGKANKDREWHKSWYQTILYKRYNYDY